MKCLVAFLLAALAAAAGIAHAGVSIVFDYSLDAHGFFTPQRRALTEAAAASLTSRLSGTQWARVDAAVSGGSYELAIVNPSTLQVSWLRNVVIPENRVTVYLGAFDWSQAPVSRFRESTGDGTTQLMSLRNASGGVAAVLTSAYQFRPVDASISFDLRGIQGLRPGVTRQWYFGSPASLDRDDRNPADPLYASYTDFYTAMIHELAHVLGLYHPGAFDSLRATDPGFVSALAADAGFSRAWTSRVQPDGRGGHAFVGPIAGRHYFGHAGEPIPLDADTRSHWADSVRSQAADKYPVVSYAQGQPFRNALSELEFGALADIGYTIAPASRLAFNATGLWWNPAESGWGINLVHQGDILFATLFTYDAAGAPLWLVMSRGELQPDGITFAGSLLRTTGSAFNAVPFTPLAPSNVTPVGTMSVRFDAFDAATLAYTVNAVAVTKSVRPQAFGARVANCTPVTGSRAALANYQDLWWNAAESGWGVNVVHQDDILFATLFTYDESGRDLWLLLSRGERQDDGSWLGTLYRTTGPPFNANPFTPITAANLESVGTMRLRFADGTRGTMSYSYRGRPVDKAIARQEFANPLAACN